VEKAEEHIVVVSANLDAEVISTVQKNREELEMYANIPSREVQFVPRNDQDPFEKIISKVIHLRYITCETQIKTRYEGKL